MSRQSARYGEIRKMTASFDGVMSAIYRSYGALGKDAQEAAGEILSGHYTLVREKGWDYPFTHKTTTLTDLHALLEETARKNGTDGIRGSTITMITRVLQDVQKDCKQLVALREERIPKFQWILIYLLAAILVLSIASIASAGLVVGSLIKAAFVVSVFVVIWLLKRFDDLHLFEQTVGEHSASDVLDIIAGKK